MRRFLICCAVLALGGCAAPVSMGSSLAQIPAGRPLAASIPLDHPIGLAENKDGELYVANAGSSQILVYNSKNQQLAAKTITDGVDQPADLIFDKAGNLYASERSAADVTVYTPSGKLIKTIHTDKATGYAPSGVQISSAGDLWVANRDNTNYDVGEIQVFNASGKVIHSSSQELDYPIGLVFEGTDAWVFDSTANAITVFDSSAKFVKVIPLSGISPNYAAKNGAGDLYVTDAAISKIGILNASGKVLKTAANKGLDNPTGIVFNKAGDFYVANENNNTITEYSSKGDLIRTIR
ncbi:MAG: NHL repeat-containing protein [Candidatus Cybelea sp.]